MSDNRHYVNKLKMKGTKMKVTSYMVDGVCDYCDNPAEITVIDVEIFGDDQEQFICSDHFNYYCQIAELHDIGAKKLK